jgi:biotin carboxyl carrier protein
MERWFRYGTRHLAVAVQRTAAGHFTVAVDGAPHTVEATLLDPSLLELVVDGITRTLPVMRVGDAYHIAIDGEVYVLTPEVAGVAATDHPVVLAPPQIVAPMPGKVLQVLVGAGQRIGTGDGLLVLEAMKMEHRITAEAPATVRAVHVADGQMVDAGVVLIELEYDADAER